MNIKEAIESSSSMAEASRKVGMSFSTFKRKAESLGLYSPNQGGRGTVKYHKCKRIPLSEILDGLHPDFQTSKLKKRLYREGIKDEVCEWCGIGSEWNGNTLVLHLDHINGNSKDHRIENLRILCPNCHSQTDTYAGKNRFKLP